MLSAERNLGARLASQVKALATDGMHPGLAHTMAWAALAAVNAISIARLTMPEGGWTVRGLHHLVDAGQLLACGWLSAMAVMLWRAFGPARPVWAFLGVAIVATGLGSITLGEDLYMRANKLSYELGGPFTAWYVLSIVLVANGVTLGAAVGRLLARGWVRWLAVVVGLSIATTNGWVLRGDYPGLHLFAAWTAAALIGTALARRHVPMNDSYKRWLVYAGLGLPVMSAVVLSPPNAVAEELYRFSGSVVAPFAARFRPSAVAAGGTVPESEWFADRTHAPDMPPTQPYLLAENGIVIVLVADAMRADVANDPAHDALLPTIAALRRTSVHFTNARSVAPATAQSISALFSGRYYSQLYWSAKPGGRAGVVFPHADDTVRFPELLSSKGVQTVTFAGLPGLTNEYGIARGWTEETFVEGPNFAGAELMTPPAVDRIRTQGSGPMFLYLHFNDAHAPYNRGGKAATPFEGYLRELAIVDKAIATILAAVEEAGLADRTAVIFMSDHGESFGEHGLSFHATQIYDVVLRVPLMIRIPGGIPRTVDEPVSLLDIAPTVLDLYRVPTPGSFMGQSLTGFLRGRSLKLTRPIAAESSRMQRAMVFADGWKVIEDRRKRTTALYDIEHDPKEEHNLFGERPELAAERLHQMQSFFQLHALRRPGYEVPYGR